MKKILYISYDGMTDPLGQSQVIPYLASLSKEGYRFTILSFEKKDKYKKLKETIEGILQDAEISWVPMKFTTRPPLVAKFYDVIQMRRKAILLYKKDRYDMIHCRSYLSADIGLILKRKFGTKFFFDMRGFWADEKKDGGSWNQKYFLFRKIYDYYKRKEDQYLQNADMIVALTEAGRHEMLSWPSYNPDTPLLVIPCCVDMNHFTIPDIEQKSKARKLLELGANDLIVSYLGSLGSWYMLDEMLTFFKTLKGKYHEAKFFFITHSSPLIILEKLNQYQINEKDIVIKEATRAEVPIFLSVSDINISFIKPVYSKLSSSPTKLAEVLSMGIPVITNSGVGDVEKIINETEGGAVINDFSLEEYEKIIEKIPLLLQHQPKQIREKLSNGYSLQKGIELYKQAYQLVFGNGKY